MFIVPGTPGVNSPVDDWADFIELYSWRYGQVSKNDVLGYLHRYDDNDNYDDGGVEDDHSKKECIGNAFDEIDNRSIECISCYPFELNDCGTVLKSTANMNNCNVRSQVYLYLLLSTRINMNDNRMHEDLDGTKIFESLSAHALKEYLGFSKSKSLVFGTSIDGGFSSKLNDLCKEIGEGMPRENNELASHVKDGGLDAVAWIPFDDKKSGKLIIFCQCKTGVSWRTHSEKLYPIKFQEKYFDKHFCVCPVSALSVAEFICNDVKRWDGCVIDWGIIFDRCRLVMNSEKLADNTVQEIVRWTVSAKRFIDDKLFGNT